MKKKTILLIALGILLLVAVINYWSGTTIVINGKHITSLGKYIATYVALLVLAVALVILIPSFFILAMVLAIIVVVFLFCFFPSCRLDSGYCQPLLRSELFGLSTGW